VNIPELRRRFLPRFRSAASAHLLRASEALAKRDMVAFAHAMHALAGEAALLEIQALADPARTADLAARSGSTEECARLLAEMRKTLENLEET
jgi:HPt (histidine-containing phosphotransfer) domain-containing protein